MNISKFALAYGISLDADGVKSGKVIDAPARQQPRASTAQRTQLAKVDTRTAKSKEKDCQETRA